MIRRKQIPNLLLPAVDTAPCGNSKSLIYLFDTDVLFQKRYPNLFRDNGRAGQNQRIVENKSVVEAIGARKQQLSAFYALSRLYLIVNFIGKGNLNCLKQFENANQEIVQ